MKVGDKLWYVPDDNRYDKPREVTVVKIGRKWATVEPSYYPRIDIATGFADSGGFATRGRAYSSRELYEATTALDADWRAIRSQVSDAWSMPNRKKIDALIGNLQKISEALKAFEEPECPVSPKP